MYDEQQGTDVPTRTENATTFHAQDAPNRQRLDGTETKQEQMRRLFTEYQTGTRNGKWGDKTKLRRQDNLAMFDAIASQVELPDHLTDEGREFLDDTNLRKFGHPVRLVVFCLAAQLHNEYVSEANRYHPNRNDENNPHRVLRVEDDLDFDDGNLLSVFMKVGYQL